MSVNPLNTALKMMIMNQMINIIFSLIIIISPKHISLFHSVIKTMTVESPLTSLSFMHDGATLAAGSTRGKIYVFDLRMGSSPLKTLNAHKSSVQSIRFQNPASAAKVQ